MGFDPLAGAIHSAVKDVFGEMVTYEPLSGGSFPIRGIFNARYTGVDPDTERLVSTNQPNLGIRAGDLASAPVKGDRVIVRGVWYRVNDAQEDGEGWIKLFLYEVD